MNQIFVDLIVIAVALFALAFVVIWVVIISGAGMNPYIARAAERKQLDQVDVETCP